MVQWGWDLKEILIVLDREKMFRQAVQERQSKYKTSETVHVMFLL